MSLSFKKQCLVLHSNNVSAPLGVLSSHLADKEDPVGEALVKLITANFTALNECVENVMEDLEEKSRPLKERLEIISQKLSVEAAKSPQDLEAIHELKDKYEAISKQLEAAAKRKETIKANKNK